jgi:hypothetical protein
MPSEERSSSAHKSRVRLASDVENLRKDRIQVLAKTVEGAQLEAGQIEIALKEKLNGLALPDGNDEAERIDNLLASLRIRCADLTRRVDQNQLRLDQIKIRIAEVGKARSSR